MNLSKITMYEACLLHSRSERVLKSLVSKHLEKYDITRMEWLLLATVERPSVVSQGHTMGELAETLDIKLSQVTALVGTMHKAGLLTQKVAKKDRRTRYVSITSKGSTMLKEVEQSMRGAFRQWLGKVPRDQLIVYMKTVEQFGYDL